MVITLYNYDAKESIYEFTCEVESKYFIDSKLKEAEITEFSADDESFEIDNISFVYENDIVKEYVMSYLGRIIIDDYERAIEEKILTRAVNVIEKGNYMAVFTGGGFRVYDKENYGLLIEEKGLNYIYDGEFSDDLKYFAAKSSSGYVLFFDLESNTKIARLSMLDKKNGFDSSADCGCTFGESSNDFYDIVYSDKYGIAAINRYSLKELHRKETLFENMNFVLFDVGYSVKHNSFWLVGYERIGYKRTKSGYTFDDNSKNFIIWTKDFIKYYRFELETYNEISGVRYNECSETFLVYDCISSELLSYTCEGRFIECINL